MQLGQCGHPNICPDTQSVRQWAPGQLAQPLRSCGALFEPSSYTLIITENRTVTVKARATLVCISCYSSCALPVSVLLIHPAQPCLFSPPDTSVYFHTLYRIHKSEHVCFLSETVWPHLMLFILSPSIIFPANFVICFKELNSICFIYVPDCLYLSVDRQLSWFHFLAIVNRINMGHRYVCGR